MALTATVGSASADSFVTLAEADDYFDTRLNVTGWTGAVDADQERALKSATRELTLLAWQGVRVTTTQALAWPRDGCPNPDTTGDGDDAFYEETIIPDRVKIATYELALAYLNAGTTDLTLADQNAGVIRKKVGPLETEWSAGQRVYGWQRFPMVGDAIGPLLSGEGSSATWERA